MHFTDAHQDARGGAINEVSDNGLAVYCTYTVIYVQVPKPQIVAHPEAGCHSDSDSDRAGRCQGASSTEAENAARSVTAPSAPPPHACRYDAMYIPGYRYVPLRGAALRR